MPTLLELFNNGKLTQGPYANQTPKDAFTPRNSNKIELSSSSPVINATTMKLLNKLRSGNGSTLEETLIEQETTGVRMLGTLSQPLLYGSEFGRILLKETLPLGEMKLATSGLLPSGPLGKAFKSVTSFARKTLGIPSLATPTYTLSDGSLESQDQIQAHYARTLRKIKDSAEGSLLGKFLKGGAGSLTDPEQLKNKAIGAAVGLASGFLRDKLIGGGSTPQTPFDYGAMPTAKGGAKLIRNYGSKNEAPDRILYGTPPLPFLAPIFNNALGSMYSTTIKVTTKDKIDTYEKFVNTTNRETPIFVEKSNEDKLDEGGLIAKMPPLDLTLNRELSQPKRNPKLSDAEIEKRKQSIDSSKGDKYNQSSFGNIINKQLPYDIDEGLLPDGKNSIDDLDTIVLKFESIKQNKAVNFLATLSGLSESFSPSWNSGKFIGNPFNFYTYDGIERSVSFSFKVFSLNPNEHISAWNRLNFLTSLVYPQAFEGDAGYITAPFLRLTIGDMYKRKEGFLESLSYSVDDSTPWEIGKIEMGNDVRGVQSIEELADDSMANYKLPRIINVETTFKFIEQRNSVSNHSYYPFASLT
jgi:hypothetical protein